MNPQALVVSAPHQLTPRSVELPCLKEKHALVGVEYSCISPGTESRVIAGLQQGMPPFPVVPGYSAVGTILEVGSGSSWKAGERVFLTGAPCLNFAVCWGAHQSHVVLPDGRLIAVPEGVDPVGASAAKLAAIAEHGQRIAGVGAGEQIAVLGLGPIGFFAALCAKARGAKVTVWDVREARRAKALEIGLDLLPEQSGTSPGFDVVVDATGSPKALGQAVALLREKPWDDACHPSGRLVVQGSYAGPPPLPYDELFWKEATVFIPRDNQARDIRAVFQLMAEDKLPVGAVLHDFGSPSDALHAHEMLAKGDLITGFFRWM